MRYVHWGCAGGRAIVGTRLHEGETPVVNSGTPQRISRIPFAVPAIATGLLFAFHWYDATHGLPHHSSGDYRYVGQHWMPIGVFLTTFGFAYFVALRSGVPERLPVGDKPLRVVIWVLLALVVGAVGVFLGLAANFLALVCPVNTLAN